MSDLSYVLYAINVFELWQDPLVIVVNSPRAWVAVTSALLYPLSLVWGFLFSHIDIEFPFLFFLSCIYYDFLPLSQKHFIIYPSPLWCFRILRTLEKKQTKKKSSRWLPTCVKESPTWWYNYSITLDVFVFIFSSRLWAPGRGMVSYLSLDAQGHFSVCHRTETRFVLVKETHIVRPPWQHDMCVAPQKTLMFPLWSD